MEQTLSLLKPLGYQKNRTCGYCKKADSGTSPSSDTAFITHPGSCYYLSSDNMSVENYQALVDRGWRRSGQLYYKQDLPRSCCPHYTIRLDASEFKAKKSQRQTLNRWNKHVLGYEYIRKEAILCPRSRGEKKHKRDRFAVRDAVHISEYSNLGRPISRKTGQQIEPAYKFEVTLEPDAFTVEKYDVFLRYQMKVHKEPKSRWSHASFKRFLCSGLDQKVLRTNGMTQKLGSYHQCYRLDGRLIAVGVLDLLPRAVSSVYLFYDPDFEQWAFGKLSALREVALALEGQYNYYYMGFYIHSCIKMRYKAAFQPTYMLDPESLSWSLFDNEHRKELDRRPYVSISHLEARQGDANTIMTTNNERGEENLASSGVEATLSTPAEKAAPKIINANEEMEVDADVSSESDTEIPEGSLFDRHMPGVLTKEEVIELDLDHWKLRVRDSFVDLEDLRGWEDWELGDPYSIKGMAGELAATIGPKVMKESAVVLF